MGRRKGDKNEDSGSGWIVTYADLMSILLCFFVLLFATSTVDAEKYEAIKESMAHGIGIFTGSDSPVDRNPISINPTGNNSGNSITDSTSGMDSQQAEEWLYEQNKSLTSDIYDDISDKANEYQIADELTIEMDSAYRFVEISVSGSILFDSGKAEIKAEAIPLFSKLGDVLQRYKDYHIELEGHTDNQPIRSSTYPDNNWLSSARALNAATYLINEKGMNPDTLSWSGRGEYDPVASNSSEEGRAKNRRVEIKIYNKYN